MAFRAATPVMVAISLAISAGAAFAQFNEDTCKPYRHGEVRSQSPTMFCETREDAQAYIDLIELRRTNKISVEEGRKALAEFRMTRECVYALTSHISRRTLHKATEEAPYCKKLGFPATKWPSLIEAELSGDGAKIWIITYADVPPEGN